MRVEFHIFFVHAEHIDPERTDSSVDGSLVSNLTELAKVAFVNLVSPPRFCLGMFQVSICSGVYVWNCCRVYDMKM